MIPIIIRGGIAILLAGTVYLSGLNNTLLHKTEVVELPTPKKQITDIETNFKKYEKEHFHKDFKEFLDEQLGEGVMDIKDVPEEFLEELKDETQVKLITILRYSDEKKFEKLRDKTIKNMLESIENEEEKTYLSRIIRSKGLSNDEKQRMLIRHYLINKYL